MLSTIEFKSTDVLDLEDELDFSKLASEALDRKDRMYLALLEKYRENGFLIMPDILKSMLDELDGPNFRNMFIDFKNNAEVAIAYIRHHLTENDFLLLLKINMVFGVFKDALQKGVKLTDMKKVEYLKVFKTILPRPVRELLKPSMSNILITSFEDDTVFLIAPITVNSWDDVFKMLSDLNTLLLYTDNGDMYYSLLSSKIK